MDRQNSDITNFQDIYFAATYEVQKAVNNNNMDQTPK